MSLTDRTVDPVTPLVPADSPAPAPTPGVGVETHGIEPVPADRRYGRPGRLFTVWFAPNMTMTSVFTGALAIVLGLGFWSAMSAIVLGTVLGAMVPGYLGTLGPRTGSGQLPLARLPFGRSVVLPGVLAWGSAVAWDALVGVFGGQAVEALTGLPFWVSVILVLALQAVVGFFGYEVVHRFQMVASVLLGVAFVVLTVRILGAATPVTGSALVGADAVGTWMLMVAIAFSLSVSWAPYAADFSRYLPADVSRRAVFWATTAGLTTSFVWGQAIGAAGASVLSDQTATGVADLLGGGVFGSVGLVTIALAAVSSNAMNDYSGSLSLQTVGLRVPRPVAALVVAAAALLVVLWMNSGEDLSGRFLNVLLAVSYWIPAFVAVVVLDWSRRPKAADGTVDVAAELEVRHTGWPAAAALLSGMASTLLFMNTAVWVGPVAVVLHGADLAYYAAFVVSAVVYLGCTYRGRRSTETGVAR